MNDYCYSTIIKDNANKALIESIEDYANSNKRQIYILNRPLTGLKYNYSFKDGFIVLEASKKICFVNWGENKDNFDDYCEDVLADIYSISDNYSFKDIVGRVRTWEPIIHTINGHECQNWNDILSDLTISDSKLKRKQEIILSLFIGSINDATCIKDLTVPETLLEKAKYKIRLFDTQQTRFIYQELNANQKRIVIQGMSGTGKTELLIHKCKDLYVNNTDSVIGFTCFNKVLSSDLKNRIPDFFDRMNANKQINSKRLMIIRAWGNYAYEYSGIYRYICFYYSIPFLSFRDCRSFDNACKEAIHEINKLRKEQPEYETKYAYTYMFIDESQDFSSSFFDLCELVTEKNLFIAGDIFQSIFHINDRHSLKPDFSLGKCYRTDPKTFMFAHAIGLGLFEKPKLGWLTDSQWKACGYQISKVKGNPTICELTREPIRRFEDIDIDYDSLVIYQSNTYMQFIILEIQKLQKEYPSLQPEDVAIIYVDIKDDDYIYTHAPILQSELLKQLGWKSNLAYETKDKSLGGVFISNRNNVKGLEFPFVFCLSKKISKNPQYRNVLYTMLTRSFLRSYLILPQNAECGLTKGIIDGGNEIMKEHKITTEIPTQKELDQMVQNLLEAKIAKSLLERMDDIFESKKIEDLTIRKKIKEAVVPLISASTTDEDLNQMIDLVYKNKKQ